MSSSFPPFSDITSLYLSPLLATDNLRFSTEQPPSSCSQPTTSPTNTPTPNTLTRCDAPTQLRTPQSPPAALTNKRPRSAMLCGEDDELSEEPLSPTATEIERIQWKRRQNTLAARKSRKRKQEHLAYLEKTVERLMAERETWKVRALTYQAMLKNSGIQVPDFM